MLSVLSELRRAEFEAERVQKMMERILDEKTNGPRFRRTNKTMSLSEPVMICLNRICDDKEGPSASIFVNDILERELVKNHSKMWQEVLTGLHIAHGVSDG